MIIGPAGFMRAPKQKQPRRLINVLPSAFSFEYTDTRAWKLRDVEVIKKLDGWESQWPGKHMFVFHWWILADGHAVGWNENPSRGWSFPVIRLTEYQMAVWTA